MTCARSPTTGSSVTTKSGRMTRWEACRRRDSASNYSQRKFHFETVYLTGELTIGPLTAVTYLTVLGRFRLLRRITGYKGSPCLQIKARRGHEQTKRTPALQPDCNSGALLLGPYRTQANAECIRSSRA